MFEVGRFRVLVGTKFSEHVHKLRVASMENEQGMSYEGWRRGIEARPRNWLVAVILVTLFREGDSHGYELMERTAPLGFETMNPGTLYRTLRQMEKEGLCESAWETSRGGPARRVYSITGAGERQLADFWVKSLEQYQQMMDSFFRLYTSRPPRAGGGKGEGDG